MAADPLDQVLRLVAEGRLSAEEAGPILAALDAADDAAGAAGRAGGAAPGDRSTPPGEHPFEAGPDAAGASGGGTARALRIEVRDGGRQVVNLRLPLALGRYALDRVPGLTGDAASRVREALDTGMRGPVLVVDEGEGSGVRIVLE